jgi:hypothetical protein
MLASDIILIIVFPFSLTVLRFTPVDDKKLARGGVLVEALCDKLEGHGLETQWGNRMFSIYLILPAALGRGIYLASNRN